MDFINSRSYIKSVKKQVKPSCYLLNLVVFMRLNLFVKWLDNTFAKEQLPPNKYR